jgi:hypothetical protein
VSSGKADAQRSKDLYCGKFGRFLRFQMLGIADWIFQSDCGSGARRVTDLSRERSSQPYEFALLHLRGFARLNARCSNM